MKATRSSELYFICVLKGRASVRDCRRTWVLLSELLEANYHPPFPILIWR